MEEKQSRWKSPVLWAAIVAQIIVIFSACGLWDAIGITSDTFKAVATAVLQIFVIVGVINNPENPQSL